MNDTEVVAPVADEPRGPVSYAELQRHTNSSSIWVLIGGIVYDVTSLLSSHPGGTGPLFKYAGKDATLAISHFHNLKRTDGDYGYAAKSLCRYTHRTPFIRCRTQRALDPSTQPPFPAL